MDQVKIRKRAIIKVSEGDSVKIACQGLVIEKMKLFDGWCKVNFGGMTFKMPEAMLEKIGNKNKNSYL